MESLGTLGGGLIADVGVFVLVQVIHVKFTLRGNSCKYSRRIWCPLNVSNLRLKIESNNWSFHVLDPHFDGPISTARQEGVWMISVPLNSVDSKIMIFVGLKVLARVSLRAEMDLTFFSSDKEQMVRVSIKVEAHTSSEAVEEAFFFVIMELFLFVNNKFEFYDFFWLKLILHEVPVGNSTI